ncbi:Glycosyltransferase 25 family member [Tetrabaena socialis]|uniref:Glycosyltransferase 25 family member n=1 Tax=Tetrabaena socialis TaxID=47790 RepID=A0A2J8AJ84_9CHLO|nr:Glycosyltransferase 25 family member [Tetrabaena socialis]|eukprot:PNH12579.1 Glycosyltransferase 25 family member [Tetrabaena socialis]
MAASSIDPFRISWVAIAIVIAGMAIVTMRKVDVESYLSELKCMCFVINLERNKERLLRFMIEYSRSDMADVPLRPFAAIDASRIDIGRFVTAKTMRQIETTNSTGFRKYHHEMTAGAVGCFLSHISIMRMLIQDPQVTMYVIFEDDTTIPPVMYKALQKAILDAPAGWDIVVFGYHFATMKEEAKNDNYEHLKTFWGTHAYCINKRGAQKIVKEYEEHKIGMQIDSMMSVLSKRGGLSVYAANGQWIRTKDMGSDIQVHVKHIEGIDPYDLDE